MIFVVTVFHRRSLGGFGYTNLVHHVFDRRNTEYCNGSNNCTCNEGSYGFGFVHNQGV